MKPEEMDRKLEPVIQRLSEQDVLSPYNDATSDRIHESKEKMQQWTKEDYLNSQQKVDRINQELTEAIRGGESPESPRVQDIIRQHYESMTQYYTPTADVYRGLGELYVEQPEYKKLFDSYHPRLARFLCEAMRFFADHKLK
ncbi:hypothetical protein J23TS9_32340 [Paenibacillus sp. J23TS9]|uniref:TipAS antibiotic-recognition domain-containing protein n=1 Tax=Paenibacillus sp. J23TS9 TaxID=2807193 RepID=UPI001B2ADDED|nr:TipAS antibiotic-recognition domain-containing protein [Paenibacillus sp. J23TS9]GIP28104.1 hypothetical protein J23TS9_32340 [Paenibacillus sp. J23TS9]